MKVIGIDNKEYSLNLTKYVGKQRNKCSEYHKNAREILKTKFPFDQILEEVLLPSTQLYADFFIPKRQLIVEVQGEQHSNFVPYYHKDKQAFGKAKRRDKVKLEWCEINNITLVEFSYDETPDVWIKKLVNV